jgi:excisionase family DNA binding protein
MRTTKRITSTDELTEEVVREEILYLLRKAEGHIRGKKALLLLGSDFSCSDEELLEGPIGRSMKRIFDHVTGRRPHPDPMAIAELCEKTLEFLWSSLFSMSCQIPDDFWDTPLGFAIYDVIGRISDLPDNKELTSLQAAKFLGISQPYLYKLTKENKIPVARKVGTHHRYRFGDLKDVKSVLFKPK